MPSELLSNSTFRVMNKVMNNFKNQSKTRLIELVNENAMMGYVYSPAHQKAIDLYDVLGQGLTCHYESEEIPSSKHALDYWKANGQ